MSDSLIILAIAFGYLAVVGFAFCLARAADTPAPKLPSGMDARPPARPIVAPTTQASGGPPLEPARRTRLSQVDRRSGMSGPGAP